MTNILLGIIALELLAIFSKLDKLEEFGQAAVDIAVYMLICVAKLALIITAPVWLLPYKMWRKGRKE